MPDAFEPPASPPDARLAIRIWNDMGAAVDWAAFPILCEMYGVIDPERVLRQLIAIRDHNTESQNHGDSNP